METRFADRMARAAAGTERAGLTGLLVTPGADLRYLSGYDPPALPRLTCLVLRPGRDALLLVPALERARAEESSVGRSVDIVTWNDGDDPYVKLRGLVEPTGSYGVADRTWAVHLLALQRELTGASFAQASVVLAPIRSVKDEDELERLGRVARTTDEGFRRIVRAPLEGRREEEVAHELAEILEDLGHDAVNFTILASGPNGASPHHEPGGRTIRGGDAVVLDFGGRIAGYCSDLSRTLCVGGPPRGFDEVYAVVREAQEAAFQMARPGVPAEDVDRAARDVLLDRARHLSRGPVRGPDRGHRRPQRRWRRPTEPSHPGPPARRVTSDAGRDEVTYPTVGSSSRRRGVTVPLLDIPEEVLELCSSL